MMYTGRCLVNTQLRRLTITRKQTMTAVKQLRDALGLTQTEFAQKLGRGLSTVQRWERDVPPRDEALLPLVYLAHSSGHEEIARSLRSMLSTELGLQVITAETPISKTYTPVAVPIAEIELLDGIFQRATQDEIPEYKEILTRWYGITRRIRLETTRSREKEMEALKARLRDIKAIIVAGKPDDFIVTLIIDSLDESRESDKWRLPRLISGTPAQDGGVNEPMENR